MSSPLLSLDLLAFDLPLAARHLARAEREGVVFGWLAEALPASASRVYTLLGELGQVDPFVLPFSAWSETFLRALDPSRDLVLLVWRGRTLVGLHHLKLNGRDARAVYTGTAPAFRRRGIASALKAVATLEARARGVERVWTHAHTGAIGAINAQFGFLIPSPAGVEARR